MNKLIILLLLGLAARPVSAADLSALNALKAGAAAAGSVPEASLPADMTEKKPPAGPEYTVHYPTANSPVTVANRTGLMWLTNPDAAGVGGTYDRHSAIVACKDLNYAGFSDWRLPKPMELTSIINVNGPYPGNNGYFLNPKTRYWTSSPPAVSAAIAWSLAFAVGSTYNIASTGQNHVQCVREVRP